MKTKYGTILFLTLLVGMITFVAADQTQLLCLNKGQKVEFSKCNPEIKDRTCSSDLGCSYCVTLTTSGVYCPASFNACNSGGLSCSGGAGNYTLDAEPPILILNNPEEGKIYGKKSILLDISLNEKANIYYDDLSDGKDVWTKICSTCTGLNRTRTFEEGLNNLTFKATDVIGNSAYLNLSFYIDSKSPKIKKTEPRKGFSDGEFFAEIDEENIEEIFLNYGNNESGFRNEELNVNDDCTKDKRYKCNADVDLSDYDGEEIEYWFSVIDIADSNTSSRKIKLDVDTSSPVINSLNYTIDGNKVLFKLNITEENLDEITYVDLSESNPRERKLCSRLKDGVCSAKKVFKEGGHEVSIQIVDKAGNAIATSVNFEIL